MEIYAGTGTATPQVLSMCDLKILDENWMEKKSKHSFFGSNKMVLAQ
jgi:hypothetical protein